MDLLDAAREGAGDYSKREPSLHPNPARQ
jgi:hypothetical protein